MKGNVERESSNCYDDKMKTPPDDIDDPNLEEDIAAIQEAIDAIEAGDSATARRLMVEHLESFGEAAVKLLGVGQKLAA